MMMQMKPKNKLNEWKLLVYCLVDDIGDEHFCQEVVSKVIQTFGKIDILVNNRS